MLNVSVLSGTVTMRLIARAARTRRDVSMSLASLQRKITGLYTRPMSKRSLWELRTKHVPSSA
ncbi:hypothetical protein DPMN_026701 [Dreissena polymorpha]|uniref:Uncharacterized protein n=1 Tax=Dreissena polymorpha TaxID=45954 RepID=A0A9D4LVQ9_DREPO|nr:hypothetical protein DPMN_026701 [Dreissena polymorpha]